MVNDVSEAIATFVGMVFAGFILLTIAQDLGNRAPPLLETSGRLFILFGVIGGAVLVYLVLKALLQ